LARTQSRVGLLFLASLILLAGILTRAFWLQGVQGPALASQAAGQQEDRILVPGMRGSILDRHGRELAGSEAGASIFATPYQIKDPETEGQAIAKALGSDPAEIRKSITAPGGFSYVERKVDLVRARRIEKLGLEGIGQHPDTIRTRPQGALAGQLLGVVSPEGEGLTGLENSYDDQLRGEDGEKHLVKDALGEPINFDTLRDPVDGASIQLTLDAAIQAEVERVLDGIGERHDPVNASAVVMDAKTSEVLAMANWPAIDPERMDRTREQDLVNIGTSYTYEPGSTFKAFTVAAALESGTVAPTNAFTLAPSITLYDRTIEEASPRGTVNLDVGQILAQSSNVGSVTLGLQMGGKKFDRWIRRFGFGKPTGIDFPGEERGIVIPYSDYSGSTMGNLPIGQGLSVTPVQMAAGYTALANGGILRPPRLVREVDGEPVSHGSGKRVVSPRVAEEVRSMLKGVFEPGGTASAVEVPGYSLAGKTGTAQIATEDGYSDTRYVGSFVGIAPADDPRIVVAVMASEPKNGHQGGVVAAPAFGEIASFALPYLGVPTD
jgi:cell division protein FtsI/penicillin-binding protein 2